MLKAQGCYYKGFLESLLEKTNKEGQQTRGPMAMATEALSQGSSQLLLALSLLWQEMLLGRSRQQLDAQSSPRNPCLSRYLYLME